MNEPEEVDGYIELALPKTKIANEPEKYQDYKSFLKDRLETMKLYLQGLPHTKEDLKNKIEKRLQDERDKMAALNKSESLMNNVMDYELSKVMDLLQDEKRKAQIYKRRREYLQQQWEKEEQNFKKSLNTKREKLNMIHLEIEEYRQTNVKYVLERTDIAELQSIKADLEAKCRELQNQRSLLIKK